jgi:GntR family transcriptional regulator/MocR family aminotransferase
MTLTYFLDKETDTPIYKQLYESLRKDILSGKLKTGAKLPSIRHFAQTLNVSVITVQNAYHQLEAEGYITSRDRSGYYVENLAGLTLLERQDAKIIHAPHHDQASEDQIIDFSPSNIDNAQFPLSIWRKCVNETLLNHETRFNHHGAKLGELPLRAAVADYVTKSRILDCTEEQVVIFEGIEHSMNILSLLFKQMGKTAIMEQPSYKVIEDIFSLHQLPIQRVPSPKGVLSLEDLQEQKNGVLYLTPSHQYPYGSFLSIQERIKIINWAQNSESYVIEDDYDGEFRYDIDPVPSLQGLSKNHVIYIGTFSKTLSPAIRVSYAILPPELMKRYQEVCSMFPSPVSVHLQLAMAKFMEDGHYERHIRRMRKYYKEKQDFLIATIQEVMGDHAALHGTTAGLHLVLELKNNSRPYKQLLAAARAHGVNIYPVKDVTPNPYFILGFSGLPREKITEGIRRLHKAWIE